MPCRSRADDDYVATAFWEGGQVAEAGCESRGTALFALRDELAKVAWNALPFGEAA